MFPATRQSVLVALRSESAEERSRALGVLAEGYWRPVQAYVRVRWQLSPDDADDATQSFFARALTAGLLDRYDPARARFRTYLRVCIDGHVANEHAAATRVKRGGGAEMVSLDAVAVAVDADACFEREWARAVCEDALAELRRRLEDRGRAVVFAVFQRYDVEAGDRPTYQQLADEFGIAGTQITNYLAAARREFRAIVLDRLRTLTASDAELRDDVRALLGIDP